MTALEVFDFEQGSPEWFAIRAGIPTASEFHTVLAKGEGKVRKTYMMKLAGEIVTGQPMDSYTNGHMERGKAVEEEIRNLYCYLNDVELERPGFLKRGRVGCSPDGLTVAQPGAVEFKSKAPHLLIEALLRGSFPPEHKAQCQGVLWISEREWIDIGIHWKDMPLVTYRATRDEDYIKTLAAEIDRFNEELDAMVEKVRAYG